MRTAPLLLTACVLALLALSANLARAADPAAPAKPASPPAADVPPVESAAAKAVNLPVEQAQVATKFNELEQLLIKMAELTQGADPRRASLLRQAVAQSKDRAIEENLQSLVTLLKKDQLGEVVKGQVEVKDDLNKLLELLLSEDRSKRIDSEKARIREYIKQVNKIIKEQKGLQGETDGDGDTKKLADEQGKLGEKTGDLAKKIDEQENPGKTKESSGDQKAGGEKSQGKPGEGKPGEGKPSEGKPGEKEPGKEDPNKKDPGKNDPGKKPEGDKGEKSQGKPGEKSEGKPGEKSEGKPGEKSDSQGEGKPSEGKPSEGKPQKGQGKPMPGQGQEGEGGEGQDKPQQQQEEQDQNPAQKRIAQAEQRMQEAKKKLEEAKRDEASDKQQEAIKELEKAIADLEAILRQLREEEAGRMLAMLEARFRKMLEQQVQVYEGTQRVDRVPEPDRDRDHEIEAGRLSRKEAEIVSEADRALALLQEDGTSTVFPEAIGDMRDDMEQVVVRLAQAKVGEITQGIEQDIIAALEEMIAALVKAQKDREKKPPGQGGGGGGGGDPPLVDKIAELKMVRALQMRVNQRTQRYAEMTKTEQAEKPELLKALSRLAEREQRIHKVTRDIVVGRNQ